MNISYNWLKEYLSFDMQPEDVAAALTSIGLETGGIEKVQSVKGGMEGLVIGEVITCAPHPNSDHLNLTTVNLGNGNPVGIVCGASNVRAGQKVVVATVGTKLYHGDEIFTIKRSKIRGEESNGMICAEDEIGIGNSHEGIIVLPDDAQVGMSAKEYFQIEDDYILEVDITPNRVDSTSHWGVARDLSAYLKQSGMNADLKRPSIDAFHIDDPNTAIVVKVENKEACIRYSGVTIKGVTVNESPDWLKKRLCSIGLRPINNVVDITNYVLHELGQPLHAFDACKIKDNKVIVKTMSNGTKFVTLDGIERSLTDQDLMICDNEKPMCIAGVFGGLDSGVTEKTTDVFLESACFHPTWIRKTSRRFALKTDASFRFERGLDPNQTIYVLKRAALLIKEIAGGKIVGDIQDVYPDEIKPYPVYLAYKKINSLIGKIIPIETVKSILSSLEMQITKETEDGLFILVPVYRIDVRRDVDVIEDILRIYGYNNIEIRNHIHSTLSHLTTTDRNYKLENLISEQLCGAGFNEIMNNSLTRLSLYEPLTTFPALRSVLLINPLSNDLNCMRQTLLFGGLQSIGYNNKYKQKNLRFFEFGNCYSLHPEKKRDDDAISAYKEEYHIGLWISGQRIENNWAHTNEDFSVYELKAHVENILKRLGIDYKKLFWNKTSDDIFSSGLILTTSSGKVIGYLGIIHQSLLKIADIENDVYFAELSWKELMQESKKAKVLYRDISKFPEVKRDLALLLNKEITFDSIEKIAFETERKLLKRVLLFDVYEGSHLPAGKKSYAVSFYLQDENKTLTDKQIDAIIKKIQTNLEKNLGAQLR